MSDELTLRPVQDEDFAVVERLTADPEAAGEFEWFGWRDNRVVRQRWEQNRLLAPERGMLIAEVAGELAGFVFWRRARERASSYCFAIGIALVPEMQGRGYGTAAQRALAQYLFLHTPVNRIEAETEEGNLAEQRALEKAGFTREGVQRSTVFRAGQWRNGVTYSILRAECPLPD